MDEIDWKKAFRKELELVITPKTSWTWIHLENLLPFPIDTKTWYGDKFYFLGLDGRINSISPDGTITTHQQSRGKPRVGKDGRVYYLDLSRRWRCVVSDRAAEEGVMDDVFPCWPVPGIKSAREVEDDASLLSSGETLPGLRRNPLYVCRGNTEYKVSLHYETCVGPNHLVLMNRRLWCRPINMMEPYTGPSNNHKIQDLRTVGFFEVNLDCEIDYIFSAGFMNGSVAIVAKTGGDRWLIRKGVVTVPSPPTSPPPRRRWCSVM